MQDIEFVIDGASVAMQAERTADGVKVMLPAGNAYELSDVRLGESTVSFTDTSIGPGGSRRRSRNLDVPFAQIGDAIDFSWQGNVYRFKRHRGGASAASAAEPSGSVSAPTGGVVADLLVTVGQEIDAYQPIAVIEAMKVMTPIDAPISGRVAELFVERGQRIEQGASIARIEPIQAS